MEESILKSTKKILGLADDYTAFDLDVITHINAAFSILNQLGVGQVEGFMILDDVAVWQDFLVPMNQLNLVKTYVYLKVRTLFQRLHTSLMRRMNTSRKSSGDLIRSVSGNLILLTRWLRTRR